MTKPGKPEKPEKPAPALEWADRSTRYSDGSVVPAFEHTPCGQRFPLPGMPHDCKK